ncbi:thioredoxin-domain-containing protein [Mycena amicta]|nr:thioredoxin-domain-containing protein [Mycena amicta]
MSNITHLTSLSQLNGILSKSSTKLSVIDFHATWCKPCHAIAPLFESLSKDFKDVNFLKVDTDAVPDVPVFYQVATMPTFIFLKGSTKVDQVKGADRAGLESTLRRHASGASSQSGSFSGKGQTLGGPTAPTDLSHSATAALNKTTAQFSNLDPQFQTFIMLVGAYAFFWYLS